MRPEGAVLIVQRMLPATPGGPAHHVFRDLHMLAVLGGRERTQEEYAALLSGAGLRLARCTTSEEDPDVLEARLADGRP
jgi:hypothetical protein